MIEFETDIEKATKEVKKHHSAQKKEASALSNARDEFFCAATERLEAQPRAQQTILIPLSEKITSNDEVETYVHRFYPEWKIVSIEDEPFRAIVEEDPAWMKFTYLSEDRKTVYQRGVVQFSPSLDDDALRNEDPELWIRVTRSPEEELLEQLADEHGGRNLLEAVHDFISAHRNEFARLLRPFDTLSEEDYNEIQKFIVPGKLTYRLEAPRKPKAEELE